VTTYPLQLPDLVAPSATPGEDITVPNTLTAEAPLQTPPDVPVVALREGDRILTHPEDGSPVDWRVTALSRDEDDREVVGYRTADGDTDSYTVTDPATRFTVEVRL
jgi:hypothetical protein